MVLEETFKKREEIYAKKAKDVLKGYPDELLTTLEEDGCIVPSIKTHFIRGIKNEIKDNLSEIEKLKTEKELDARQKHRLEQLEAGTIKRLHTLSEIVKPIRECEPEESKRIIELVTKDYPEAKGLKDYDELLDTIKEEERIRREERLTVSEKKKFDEEVKKGVAVGLTKKKAEQKAITGIPDNTLDLFTSKLHKNIYEHLRDFVYDGADRGEDNYLISPCGLKGRVYSKDTAKELGMSYDDVLKLATWDALDQLSAFGNKDDWRDFYVKGKDVVEGERFHRLDARDWPGCWKEIFEGKRWVTKEDIKKIAKKHGLEPGDFVEDLPEGFKKK